MNFQRKSLVDVLNGGTDRAALAKAFDDAEAASDLKPLPPGTYRSRLTSGELINAKSGTPGFAMTFTVDDGEYRGRKLWHTAWLTAAAMPATKRDLAKIGVTSLGMLDQALPVVFLCDVRVALRVDDDGEFRNRVVMFSVVGVVADPTADDDFGAPPSPAAGTKDTP